MRQPSSPRNPLRAFHRPLAGLPSIPVLAGSNQARLDREVLKAMQVPPVEARAA